MAGRRDTACFLCLDRRGAASTRCAHAQHAGPARRARGDGWARRRDEGERASRPRARFHRDHPPACRGIRSRPSSALLGRVAAHRGDQRLSRVPARLPLRLRALELVRHRAERELPLGPRGAGTCHQRRLPVPAGVSMAPLRTGRRPSSSPPRMGARAPARDCGRGWSVLAPRRHRARARRSKPERAESNAGARRRTDAALVRGGHSRLLRLTLRAHDPVPPPGCPFPLHCRRLRSRGASPSQPSAGACGRRSVARWHADPCARVRTGVPASAHTRRRDRLDRGERASRIGDRERVLGRRSAARGAFRRVRAPRAARLRS